MAKKIPVWVADYVMMGYGTGAIMAVPAHDERDFAFARKYNLPIRIVITPDEGLSEPLTAAYTEVENGKMVNSGPFTGVPAAEGKNQVIAWLGGKGIRPQSRQLPATGLVNQPSTLLGGHRSLSSTAKNVVPSRFRRKTFRSYCPKMRSSYQQGESPLKHHPAFLHTDCPRCGGPARRETDTMDTFICSSWYQYAYLSPYYEGTGPFDQEEAAYWLPVDLYTGGVEHACMHLIYTRFFTKAMRDLGLVNFDEPMLTLRNQGIILGEDSEKDE